jgi:hypothetical protein
VSVTLADRSRRWSIIAILAGVLGMAAKETAVVAPVLAALVVWASGLRHVRGRVGWTLGMMLAAAVIYVAWRVTRGVPAGYGVDVFRLYFVKQLVVGPFASLGAPWTVGWAEAHPVRALVRSAVFIAIVTAALLTWNIRALAVRQALTFAAWVLIGILPVFSLFYVGPSLEGSRYLYLPAAGFALPTTVVAAGAAALFPWLLRTPAFVAMIMVLALPVLPAFRFELARWQEAARIRDAILAGAMGNVSVRRCGSFEAAGLADSVDGAFVFHNGLPQALRDVSGSVGGESQPPVARCRVAWAEGELLVSPD